MTAPAGGIGTLWQEQFSYAHLHALASQAGCDVSDVRVDVDGVDCRVSRPGMNSVGVVGPLVEVQLKSTIRLSRDSEGVHSFDLPLSNYDHLRAPSYSPRLLVVLEVPDDRNRWIVCGDREICLMHRAYWTSLRGYGATENTTSVRVPLEGPLDAAVLEQILDTMNFSGVWR